MGPITAEIPISSAKEQRGLRNWARATMGDKIDQKEEKNIISPDRIELLILVAACVVAAMLCTYLIYLAL